MTTDNNPTTPMPEGEAGDIAPEPRPRWGRRVLLGLGGSCCWAGRRLA